MKASTLNHISTWKSGERRELTNDLFAIAFDIIELTMFSVDSREQLDRIGKAFDSVCC
ncbi:hypothetical protein ICC18_22655 [Paenibacillus sp. WST5]|uniref:Uncharacterized protein n=1 Tax=Paenibacillus sedimenti TaxID=2770274 RepID=A0A926QM02_9BACL|nr:hypothetical protein [Paenibacillus sedimenti]